MVSFGFTRGVATSALSVATIGALLLVPILSACGGTEQGAETTPQPPEWHSHPAANGLIAFVRRERVMLADKRGHEQRALTPAGGQYGPLYEAPAWSTDGTISSSSESDSSRTRTRTCWSRPREEAVRRRTLSSAWDCQSGVIPRGRQTGEFAAGAAAASRLCMGHRATIVGTRAPDKIRGTNGPDVIVARAGHDVVHSLGGDDLVCGGRDFDVLALGGGADTATGGRGDDVVRGGVGDDVVRGGLGSDNGGIEFPNFDGGLFGGSGKDMLFGGRGDDYMDGNQGSDVSRGGRESDRMVDSGGQSRDFFVGGIGAHDEVDWVGPGAVTADLVTGRATGFGNDTLSGIENLSGWKGADTLLGNDRPNILEGVGGDDHLEGRGGNDDLDGSTGTDTLDGGAGDHDICLSGEVVLNCETS
jgi:hypothetical protein